MECRNGSLVTNHYIPQGWMIRGDQMEHLPTNLDLIHSETRLEQLAERTKRI